MEPVVLFAADFRDYDGGSGALSVLSSGKQVYLADSQTPGQKISVEYLRAGADAGNGGLFGDHGCTVRTVLLDICDGDTGGVSAIGESKGGKYAGNQKSK